MALYPILRRTATAAVIGWVCALSFFSPTHAQVSPPITSSGLNTIVSPNGNTYNITGGTRAGANLFHSFGEFGVPANNIANFLNETALPTNNILGRVTGNNPSNIFGTIRTTDFGPANLFLMNPAGIVFGPNATLNVGGSVTFTTANNIRLTDGVLFNAAPDTTADALLSSAPVAAFGFIGSTFGSITVQGSNLSVELGHAINFVGGDIAIAPVEVAPDTIQPARITAQDGQINIVSVASVGEVLASSFQPSSGMALGSINLGPGTLLDVSGDSAGTVRIRGGQLVVDNAAISADTGESNGAPIAVDIDVTGDLSITSTQSSAITARATGAGNAGEIRLNSAKMDVNFSYPEFGVLIDSSTVGAGNAGKVTVTTGNLTAINTSTGFGVFVDSGTGGTGNGGDVTIKVRNGEFLGTPINTGDAFFFGSGSAGNLYIGGADGMADSLHIDSASLSTEAFSAKAGAITLEGRDITITNNAFVSSISFLGENPITINADQLKMDTVIRVQAQTIGPGNGGDIVFTGKRLEMSNESAFITNTLGDGNAGNIRVNASELVRFTDDPQKSTPSGLFSNSIGTEGVPTSGRAGEIQIITPRLEMIGGARISTTTQTAGRGGDVTITSPEGIFISGQRTEVNPLENFGLGGSDGSGIFTRTISTDQCGGTCGKGGDQVITTGRLVLQSGGTLDSGTTGNGNSGNVEVHASDAIVISGTLVDGSPSGIFSRTIGTASDAGSGGNIALTAGQSVTISDGASVSASSTGPGNAGNIAINAGQQFEMRNSSVKTEAAQASGGNIDIQAIDRIRLVNSSISTSVLGGAGSGGNITIDPNVVILQNSRIIARAVQGAGGNITITTPLYLPDSTSIVSASSQFGLNGTVNIQSPTSNLAGTISSLPSSLRQVQSLQTGRCAALADSRSSSLIVAGRDILPAEPGGWSPSPFALMGGETDSLAMASPPVAAMIASADAPVSLRRLTPAGFLIQSFAENGLTGCRA